MHLLLVALALQLRTVAYVAPADARSPADAQADSARDARRARNEQASFERARRAFLPADPGAEGRCDVHVGRFCWWSDETRPELPPEAPSVVARRALLISLFDSLSAVHPGDDWIVGMSVHYRLESHDAVGADSAARACRGTSWWCAALTGYAAQSRGDLATADSAFSASLAAMPEDQRCQWTDIHTLLPGDARGRYEKLPCAERAAVDARYWAFGRPRLASAANDWRSEFLARRVQAWLARRSLTPQGLSWGDDSEELLLRYGWPVRWSRVERPFATLTPEISVVGHDPWPSFDFGPREELLDSLAADMGDDGWDLHSRQSAARYAPHRVERVVPLSSQLARFRRGDTTLVVGAFFIGDDSIRAPDARLAATLGDGTTHVSAPDSTMSGTTTLLLPGEPLLSGIEITDSASSTLARSRIIFASRATSARRLSDLLLYRGGGDPPEALDSALTRAIPSEREQRDQPLGVYWEAYHAGNPDDSTHVSITVERIDHSFFRSARQRIGLSDDDSPLKMNWTDSRPVIGGTSTYAVSLDLSNLSNGRYRITLTLSGDDGSPSTSSREVELVDH